MEKQTRGTVVASTKQWWLKINSKLARVIGTEGAIYPYVVKITYSVDRKAYTKRKWIHAGQPVLKVGSSVRVMYNSDQPSKGKIQSFCETTLEL